MNSAKFNILSMANLHPALSSPGVQSFVNGTQSSYDNNLNTHIVPLLAVIPGNQIDVATWYQSSDNRSKNVQYDLYDGLVKLNSDGSITIPAGVHFLRTVTLDQTLTPDVSGANAGLSIIPGTSGMNSDPNATDDTSPTPVSVPYAILWSGIPSNNILSIAIHKTDVSNSTYAITDDFILQSPDPLAPALKPVKVASAQVGTNGKLVKIKVTDLGGNLVTLTSLSINPTVNVNGSSVTVSAPVWGIDTTDCPLNYAVVCMQNAVRSSDTVTVSVQDSWCNTTGGVCEAATNFPATNLTGGSILPLKSSITPIMPVGVNISFPSDMNVPLFTNLIRNLSDWQDSSGNPPSATATFDSAGNVTSLGTNSSLISQVVGGFQNPGNSAQSYTQCIPGYYTLIYHGGTLALSSDSCTIVSGPIVDGNGNTTIVYNIAQTAPHFGPNVALVCNAPGQVIAIYPPDPAAPTTRSLDGTNKWHPQFLSKIDGFKIIRGMDFLDTNNCQVYKYSDYNTTSNLSYKPTGNKTNKVSVSSIMPYIDTGNRYTNLQGVLILVTTSSPHNIANGPYQNGTLSGFVGPGESGPNPPGNFPTVSPTDTVPLNGAIGILDVQSPTTFIVRIHGTVNATAVLNGTFTTSDFGDNAVITVMTQRRCPPSEFIDLCNTTKKHMWLNTPYAATDLCLLNTSDPTNSLFGLVFSDLNSSLDVYVEVSNEVWNFNFLQDPSAIIEANAAGQSLTVFLTHKTAHVHSLATAAKAALGWIGNLYLVYSGMGTDMGVAAANSYRVDVNDIAPYISNQPYSNSFATIYSTFYTEADRMDLYDFYLMDCNLSTYIQRVVSSLHAYYPDASVWCYEGSISDGNLSTTGPSAWSRQWGLDPRQYYSTYCGYLYTVLQQNGVKGFIDFTLSTPIRNNGVTNWTIYINCNQTNGKGITSGSNIENQSFDDFTINNDTGPVSEVGGAFFDWNAAIGVSPSSGSENIGTSAVGFSSGLTGTIGYTVYLTDGTIYQARTINGIHEIGTTGQYVSSFVGNPGVFYFVQWDSGGSSPTYYLDRDIMPYTTFGDVAQQVKTAPRSILITDSIGNPLREVQCWMSTDDQGSNVVAGTLLTNSSGVVVFNLDPGTYYLWRMSPEYTFINPTPLTFD